MIVSSGVQNAADLYGIADDNIEHQIFLYKQIAIPLGGQRRVARSWAAERHVGQAADLFDQQVIIPQRGLRGKRVEIINDLLQV